MNYFDPITNIIGAMVNEKFQTLLSMELMPRTNIRVARLLSPSDAMAMGGKDSLNLISLDQISAESKHYTLHES